MKNILLLLIFVALISCSKNPSDPAAPDTTGEDASKPKTWLDMVKNKKVTQDVNNDTKVYYTFLENGDIKIDYSNNNTDGNGNNKQLSYIFQYAQTPTNAVYEELTNSIHYGFIGFIISNENILYYTGGGSDTAEEVTWESVAPAGPLENQ